MTRCLEQAIATLMPVTSSSFMGFDQEVCWCKDIRAMLTLLFYFTAKATFLTGDSLHHFCQGLFQGLALLL